MGLPTLQETIQDSIRSWAVRITTTLNMDTSGGMTPTINECMDAAVDNALCWQLIQEDRDREAAMQALCIPAAPTDEDDPGQYYLDEAEAAAAVAAATAVAAAAAEEEEGFGGTAPAPSDSIPGTPIGSSSPEPPVALTEAAAAMAPHLLGYQGAGGVTTHSFTFNLVIQAAVWMHGPQAAVPGVLMSPQLNLNIQEAMGHLHTMLPEYLFSDLQALLVHVAPYQVNQLLHTQGNQVGEGYELPSYLDASVQEATMIEWGILNPFEDWVNAVIAHLHTNHPMVVAGVATNSFPSLSAAMQSHYQQMLRVMSPAPIDVFAGFRMMLHHQWISPPPVSDEEEEADEFPNYLPVDPTSHNDFMESIGYRVQINTCYTFGDAW
eukprot:7382063-Prymnesium_polylepis.2